MSSPSPVLKTALFVFAGLAAGTMIYRAATSPCCDKEAPPSAISEAAPVAAAAVKPAEAAKTALVYYFYTSARCHSCNTLERYTREAVEGDFKDPYKGWRVEFRGVNVDEPANRHFVEDYKLASKAVVAQKFEGDKPLAWKELPDVWRLLGNKELFAGYVVGEIQGLLDAE
jgi:hypothetical protein